MQDREKFLEVALGAIKKAEPIFVRSFGKASQVYMKAGAVTSFVTDTDREIETLLSKEISSQFPAHAIVGEEFTPKGESASYTWYIDPIDGTSNYIHGIENCSISVGLWDTEGPLLGIVADPINNVVFHAVRGKGAFKGDVRLEVSQTSLLKDSFAAIGWNKDSSAVRIVQTVGPHVSRMRALGGTALDLCHVAAGHFDVFVTAAASIWDAAAGILILAEAGGKATLWNGERITPAMDGIAASNGKVHEELLQRLK